MAHENNAPLRAAIIGAVILLGLILDQRVEFWGQTLTNLLVWTLFLHWLRQAQNEDRVAYIACVVYAALGEIFLSLIWGLYDYHLGNVPLFVPPGHALLFMFGTIAASRLRDWICWFVPLAAAPIMVFMLLSGTDTFGALLYVTFLLCVAFGRARKLYAVMFVLALAMEIFGTASGNWTWASTTPWLGLVTVNPPIAAGAFYCILDMLVVATVSAYRTGSLASRSRPSLPAVTA
jgi:hypothetical protein